MCYSHVLWLALCCCCWVCCVGNLGKINQTIEQHPGLDPACTALGDDILPGAHRTDGCIVEHEP
jgi:hypothetical protein